MKYRLTMNPGHKLRALNIYKGETLVVYCSGWYDANEGKVTRWECSLDLRVIGYNGIQELGHDIAEAFIARIVNNICKNSP